MKVHMDIAEGNKELPMFLLRPLSPNNPSVIVRKPN